MKKNLEKILDDHMREDALYHDRMNRLLFGDEQSGELGMKQKQDEIYDFIMSYKHVSGFFGGVGGALKWLLIIGAVVGLIRGWWTAVLGYLLINLR